MTYSARLPDAASRYGTVFTYQKTDSEGHVDTCAIFDNNRDGAMYMKLKLCPDQTSRPCSIDEGKFTQYAGPVRVINAGVCPTLTAIMKFDSGATAIDRVFMVPPCD